MLQIEKGGVTPGVMNLIDRELEQKHLIKIKILSSALPQKDARIAKQAMVAAMASGTQSRLVMQTGNVAVLYRA